MWTSPRPVKERLCEILSSNLNPVSALALYTVVSSNTAGGSRDDSILGIMGTLKAVKYLFAITKDAVDVKFDKTRKLTCLTINTNQQTYIYLG